MFSRTNTFLWLCCSVCAIFLSSFFSLANAAGLTKKGEVKIEDTYNPRPDSADLALPMPCNVSMVFRAVGVPVKGYLNDYEAIFGCDDCERPGLEFYERQYSQGISGPFRLENLSGAWQKQLSESGEAAFLEQKAIYLIGKYEVSTQQWDAIMGNACPDLSADSAKPKGNMSWFDAVEFTRKYMDWLIKEHKTTLPGFKNDDKNIGYLRLPTEREWEYAARGGHKVSSDSLRNESLFERDSTKAVKEYAVYVAEGAGQVVGSAQKIGSKLKNPLGLYDTAGNVAEMVLDPFFFSAGGRLVGAAGGFVRKGGSFLTGYGEILPGRREECAFYVQSGESKARDLGVRLVLSAVNIPTQERLGVVKEEWQQSGKESPGAEQQSWQMSADVAKLLKDATEEQKKVLADLQNAMKDRNIALLRQQEQMARLQVKSSIYMIESIRNLFIRRKPIKNQLGELEAKQKISPKDAHLAESIKKHKEYIALFDTAISANVGHYKTLVEESSRFPNDLFDAEVAFIKKEIDLPANDAAAKWQVDNMKKCFEKYTRHLKWYRSGKQGEFTLKMLREDMVSKDFQ